jgi:biopolymer transport protein TolR
MAFNNDNNSSDEYSTFTDINITPFVDVVLVLLVIFMVTTPLMVKESLKVSLPKSQASEITNQKSVGVVLNKLNQIILEGEFVTYEALTNALLQKKQNDETVEVLISADKEVTHGEVIKLINAIKMGGVDKFSFQIEKTN